MSPSISAVKAPIRSQFADDADFRDLLTTFVDAIPERCRSLVQLHESGAVDELGRLAHQLKGAGGGYGFSEISVAAAELQLGCRVQNREKISRSLYELLDLLARVEA